MLRLCIEDRFALLAASLSMTTDKCHDNKNSMTLVNGVRAGTRMTPGSA